MVEQAHAGEGHDDAAVITFFDDQVVTDGAAGLSNVLNTGSGGTFDIIAEGEESVGAKGHILTAGQPGLLILLGQPLRLAGEVVLPDAVGADILLVAVDIAVDHIIPVGTAQVLTEGQVQGLGC